MSSDKFNIGVDFGGVLSLKDTEGAEHVNTAIDMPFAVENLEIKSPRSQVVP